MGVAKRAALAASLGLLVLDGLWVAQAAGEPHAFGDPVVISPANEGTYYEPLVAVGPDGGLFVHAPPGAGIPSSIFRSGDGRSWSRLPTDGREPYPGRDGYPGGADSDLAFGPLTPSGEYALHFADLWSGNTTVSTSADGGQHWAANPVSGLPIQDRPWIATNESGDVFVAYSQTPLGIMVARSIATPTTYPFSNAAATTAQRATQGDICVCSSGNIIASGDRVGVIYTTNPPPPVYGDTASQDTSQGVAFALSEDKGITFRTRMISLPPRYPAVETGSSFPVVADAGGEHLVAVWLESADVGGYYRTRVRFADSRDWGRTWSPSRTIVGDGTSVFPWVAARKNKIAISLYHTDAVGARPGEDELANAAWRETYVESIDGGAHFSDLMIVDPVPAKVGPICTDGIRCGTLGTTNRELGDFQSVAIDHLMRANFAWTRVDDDTSRQLMFSRQWTGVGSVGPAVRGQGARAQTITISGSGFSDGAEVAFTGSGITVKSTILIDDEHVAADITVAPDAEPSVRDVLVTNPGGTIGYCAECFRVSAAPTAGLELPAGTTGMMKATFNAAVTGVSPANVRLEVVDPPKLLPSSLHCRDASDRDLPCSTGPVTSAVLRPAAPLISGERYVAVVGPDDAAPITDGAGGVVRKTVRSFRGPLSQEESAPASVYGWRRVATPSAFGGSYSTERLSGAIASYIFTGTTLTWYTVSGPDQGLADVYIDGRLKGTFNQYAASTRYRVARTFRGLPAGTHRALIVVRGRKGAAAARDSLVAVDGFAAGGVVNSSPLVTYGWRAVGATGPSGGRFVESDLRGASVSFTFRGTYIRWHTVLGPGMGTASVYVDGVFRGTFDQYARSTLFGRYRSFGGLADRVHIIRIVVIGGRRVGSTGSRVAIDRWAIA